VNEEKEKIFLGNLKLMSDEKREAYKFKFI